MRIKVADGQILHAVEHLLTHLFEISLRDDRHELRIDRARDERHDIHADEQSHDARQIRRNVRPAEVLNKGVSEKRIETLHEECGNGRDRGIDDDAYERDGKHDRIIMEQRLQKPLDGPLLDGRALGHRLRFSCHSPHLLVRIRRSHRCLLPASNTLPRRSYCS